MVHVSHTGSPSVPVGKWLEMIGMDSKPSAASRAAPAVPSSVIRRSLAAADPSPEKYEASATPVLQPKQMRKEVKKEEKDPGGLFEPWLDIIKGNCKALEVRSSYNSTGTLTPVTVM